MSCHDIEKLLSELGLSALAIDREAAAHLESCADCARLVETLRGLDAELEALPGHEPSQELVEKTLAAVLRDAEAKEPPSGGGAEVIRHPSSFKRWHELMAAAAVAVIAIGLTVSGRVGRMDDFSPDYRVYGRSIEATQESMVDQIYEAEIEEQAIDGNDGRLFKDERRKRELAGSEDSDEGFADELKRQVGADLPAREPESAKPKAKKEPVPAAPMPAPSLASGKVSILDEKLLKQDGEAFGNEVIVTSNAPLVDVSSTATGTDLSPDFFLDLPIGRSIAGDVLVASSATFGSESIRGIMSDAGRRDSFQQRDSLSMSADRIEIDTFVGDKELEAGRWEEDRVAGFGGGLAFGELSETGADDAFGFLGPQAEAFIAKRNQVEGLGFLDPHGYWKNTYVPGDPELRLLAARLGQSGDATHSLARQAEQPFDPPMKGALNLDVAADKTGITGPTRMLVQVGLQATERAAGRRPTMNLALVLDLDGLPSAEAGARMRALAVALAEAWEIGDRFALIVAGRAGGVAVPPGDFRHGTVAVTMGDLLSGEAIEGPSWDIVQAYREALALIATGDDPTAPLGSSGVLMVTADGFGNQLQQLSAIAHGAAVNGLPTSAVAVDPVVDPAELDSIALSGQGNRFLLERAAEAPDVVERQLSAVAQVVARALRLNVRLAPGVQLVEVIGSEKLDEQRAERVREAEHSIDQRLSRNLGIAADRGLDDDGVQIVIPSFYAGDSHVILLDVVVPGPGPIAEVSLKFKDLVGLGNGIIRDQLSLGWEELEPSQRELNVTRNLLAQQLSDTLELAANEVLYGQLEPAKNRIAEHRQLLLQLPSTLPGLASDESLHADLELLGGYLSSLEELPDVQNNSDIVDSMNYAAQSRLIQVQGLE